MERQSSVPDREFKRPETLEEIESLMQMGVDILFAATQHQMNDAAAWEVLYKQLHEMVQVKEWIIYAQIKVGKRREATAAA